MALSDKEIEALLKLVNLTRDDEIDCEQCLELVAEYTERRRAGGSVGESLRAVEHHLSVCGECREEYEALRRAVDGLDD